MPHLVFSTRIINFNPNDRAGGFFLGDEHFIDQQGDDGTTTVQLTYSEVSHAIIVFTLVHLVYEILLIHIQASLAKYLHGFILLPQGVNKTTELT